MSSFTKYRVAGVSDIFIPNASASAGASNAYTIAPNSGTIDLAGSFNHVYVATTGSDTTGDGSAGNPFATIAKALTQQLVSPTLRLIVNVAAGTYVQGDQGLIMPNFAGDGCTTLSTHAVLGFTDYGDITIEGALIVDQNLGSAVTEATRPSSLSNITTTVTATLNQYQGCTLIDDSGNEGVIFANTAGANTVLSVAITAGSFSLSGMMIIHPGVIIQGGPGSLSHNVFSFAQDNCVVVRGVKFTSRAGNANGNNAFTSFGTANFEFQICDFAALGSSSQVAEITLKACYIHPEDNVIGNAATFLGNCSAIAFNCYVTGQRHLFGGGGPFVPDFQQCFIENNIHPIAEGSANVPVSGVILFNTELSATSITIRENCLSFLSVVYWTGVSSSGTGAGLYVADGAVLRAEELIGSAGTGQLGVLVQQGGILLADVTSTLTGTLGDMQVGENAIRSWANWLANAPVQLERDALGDSSAIIGSTATPTTFTSPSKIQQPIFVLTGGDIASASTIAPTAPQHVVTGSTTINNMTPSFGTFEGEVTLIATSGTWAVATGGGTNGFAAAVTAVPGHAYTFYRLNATALWYPRG
jgi:hypothetical protein